jgi:hypothetical protein
MAAGPIPWTAIVTWCRWHRLDRDNAALVVTVIRQLDNDMAAAENARRAFEAARGGANPPPPVARGRR